MLIKSKVHSSTLVSRHLNPRNLQCIRTFIDNIELKFVADRGLDHVVEKEKDLKPVVNLKNLLKSEPSKSLPLSSIVDNSHNLRIPCRVIDFIRKYPTLFEEYFPANIGVHPHVRLTPESLNLDAEEQLIYDSDAFRKGAADRLLKLLMLCRVNEFPLKLIDMFKWDLGLPDDYVGTLVPEFPDYFKVKTGRNRVEGLLELVCWNDELAVSIMEKAAKKEKTNGKEIQIAFPLQFSNGFEMDKCFKRWLDEWQKLPYVSPYENATHLQPNTDTSDKWVVAVLHEFLHILVTKKTERDNLLCLGEYLGIKPRLKRALAHHPGIFYRSSKIGTHTVVLRDGFKRGLLIDKHPLVDMRNNYIHLMHKVKEVQKSKSVPTPSASKQQEIKAGEVEKEEDNVIVSEGEMQFSDPDVDESDDEEEEEEETEEEEQVESARGGHQYGRKGSEINEDRIKPGESRGKPRRNSSQEESDEEDRARSSRFGPKNGRKGSGDINEGRRKPGEDRGRRWRNVSWDAIGDGFDKKQGESSRGGQNHGRRGYGKAYERRRTPEEGRGKPWRNPSQNETGDEDRVESSRGRHKSVRGSGKVNEERRRPKEDMRRTWSNSSRNESGGYYDEGRVQSSRGGQNNGRRGSGKVNVDRRRPGENRGRPVRNASQNESSGGYGEERVQSSRGGHNSGRRGSSMVNEGRRKA